MNMAPLKSRMAAWELEAVPLLQITPEDDLEEI
jgi:hypothetical protein